MEQILDIFYNTCPPVWGLKQTSKTLGEHHCTENKNKNFSFLYSREKNQIAIHEEKIQCGLCCPVNYN